MSKSIWHLRDSPLPASADTVIVGAGIAGISAGLALEDRGESALILDQHRPGWGASGRNAGFLMRGAADNYAAAVRDLGRDQARMLWRLTEDNLKRLRSRGIEGLSGYRAQPSALVAFEETEAAELKASFELLHADGFEVEAIAEGDATDALWTHCPPRVGLVNAQDAVCDPVELLGFLLGELKESPCIDTRVLGFEPDGSGVIVRTDRGRIRAGRLLLCTNAYTASLVPAIGRAIEPNRGQMLSLDASTLPDDQRLRYAYYANHGSEYFRQVDDATIIVGGWRKHHAAAERTLENEPAEAVQSGLESFARRILGRSLPVTHRWAGTMGFTSDGLPLAGPVSSGEPGIWICAGFTGHGMSMAHELAHRTVNAMLGGEPLAPLFNPQRFGASDPA
jgi:gamma-glutamylputrescine oxidase